MGGFKFMYPSYSQCKVVAGRVRAAHCAGHNMPVAPAVAGCSSGGEKQTRPETGASALLDRLKVQPSRMDYLNDLMALLSSSLMSKTV